MTFSKEWDERYRVNTNLSTWPWSDLVSYVMRYARPSGPEYSVLEIGCGAGANIPFFIKLGVRYYAIEGSPYIVRKLQAEFPELEKNIVTGDFTEVIPFSEEFDLVVDRSSLTHNTTSAIKRCLALVYEKLKPGGKFIGIDWFSTLHSDYDAGIDDGDSYTRKDYTTGQFAEVGRVHFSDKAHIAELFENFHLDILEHKVIKRELPESDHVFATWNFVARK